MGACHEISLGWEACQECVGLEVFRQYQRRHNVPLIHKHSHQGRRDCPTSHHFQRSKINKHRKRNGDEMRQNANIMRKSKEA